MCFIDELLAEGMAEDDAAALDEDGDNAALAELAEDIAQIRAADDERAVLVGIGEEMAVVRNVAAAAEDDAPGLLFAGGGATIAQGESRIVFSHGFCTDDDRIGTKAKAAAVDARGIAGEPLTLAFRPRDAAIEALTGLRDDVRNAGGDPLGKGANDRLALRFERAAFHADAGEHELISRALVMLRVRIIRSVNDAADAGVLDRIRARRSAAVGAAGLERDVKGGLREELRRILLCIADGFDLGMRCAGLRVPAAADDALLRDDDGSDRRIRTGEADAALGFIECLVHPAGVWIDAFGGGHGRVGEGSGVFRARRGAGASSRLSKSAKGLPDGLLAWMLAATA